MSAPLQRAARQTAILTGPTASGKTSLALEFARAHGGIEIVNADSVLVYRGFDIGSAKPALEEREAVPHHLIDILEPEADFTAADFVRRVKEALADIHARGKRALIAGGTGFYLKSLLYGLWDAPPASPEFRKTLEPETNEALHARLKAIDPARAEKVFPNDRYRVIRALEIHALSGKTPSALEAEHDRKREPDPRFVLLNIDRADPELSARIHERSKNMLKEGLLEETQTLLDAHPDARALKSVGYAQAVDHLLGRAPSGRAKAPGEPGLIDEIDLATRQLVKSQRTWIKGQAEREAFVLERDRNSLLNRLDRIYPSG